MRPNTRGRRLAALLAKDRSNDEGPDGEEEDSDDDGEPPGLFGYVVATIILVIVGAMAAGIYLAVR
jgi:hypothetical protein